MSGASAGWHTHGDVEPGVAHRDDRPCGPTPRTPVLVVPVAGARETIARTMAEHASDSSDEQRVNGEWTWGINCDCGEFVPGCEVNTHLADAVLAALAPTSEGGRRDG